MDDHVEVILGVVLRNVLVGEGGHLDGCFVGSVERENAEGRLGFGDSACWMRSDNSGGSENTRRLRQEPGLVDGKVGTAHTEREGGGKREEVSSWTEGSLELQKSRTARVETVPSPGEISSKTNCCNPSSRYVADSGANQWVLMYRGGRANHEPSKINTLCSSFLWHHDPLTDQPHPLLWLTQGAVFGSAFKCRLHWPPRVSAVEIPRHPRKRQGRRRRSLEDAIRPERGVISANFPHQCPDPIGSLSPSPTRSSASSRAAAF